MNLSLNLGFGAGTVNAVAVSHWDFWRHVESILTRPLLFVSAIFYIPANLPPEAVNIIRWNPVLHAVEWMREGWYPNYDSAVLNKNYVLGVALVLILIGMVGERLYRKKRV